MGDRHKQGLTPILGKPLSNAQTLAMQCGQREEDLGALKALKKCREPNVWSGPWPESK